MGDGGKGGGGGGNLHDYYGSIAGLVCAGPVSALVAIIQDGKTVWPTAPAWIYAWGEHYLPGDLVSWNGVVWRCLTEHVSHPDFPPGVAPEWERYLLRRTDPGVSNPIQITVPGFGVALFYWGTADQVLHAGSAPEFAAVHPPYRRQCFVILKNWLFGREKLSAPNIEVIVAREPVQEVITGAAAELDSDHQANPIAALAEVLTDPVFGLGQDKSLLDAPSWQAGADALTANAATTHLSPVLARPQSIRSLVSGLIEYSDGWYRFDPQGRIVAGLWTRHASPPVFTAATTIDHHDLVEEAQIDSDGWSETVSSVLIRFRDRLRAHKDNAVRAISQHNRSVTGEDRERVLDRPWISRADQAALVASEALREFEAPALSGRLVVRREKATAILPGTRFLLVHEPLGLSVICRCIQKTVEAPPAMRVTLQYRIERALSPAATVEAPVEGPEVSPTPPEVITLFEFIQAPPLLSGADVALLVLAARTEAVTTSMRVHLRQSDGSVFYELGRQTRWAVRGEVHSAYSSSEPLDDDTEAFRIDIDTDTTVQVDLLGIQATQSADAINDDSLLLFVVRAANPAQFEVMTLKEIRLADGEAFYRLKVRRARFGTARLSFVTGDRVWVIRRAALRFYEHQSFPGYAAAGTTATFRLQARNLFGLEADVSDVLQCPNRTFAFSSSGIWIPSAPSGLSVSTGTGQFVLAWADNSTNEAGFRLEWSTNLSTWNSGGTVGPGVVTTSIPGPPFNQTTYWRVVAFNAAGDSEPSNAAPGYLPDTLRLDVDRVGVTVIAQEVNPEAVDVDRIGVTAVVQEAVVSALDLDRVGVTVIVQETYP